VPHRKPLRGRRHQYRPDRRHQPQPCRKGRTVKVDVIDPTPCDVMKTGDPMIRHVT